MANSHPLPKRSDVFLHLIRGYIGYMQDGRGGEAFRSLKVRNFSCMGRFRRPLNGFNSYWCSLADGIPCSVGSVPPYRAGWSYQLLGMGCIYS